MQWEGHCKQGDGRHLSSCTDRTAGEPVLGFGEWLDILIKWMFWLLDEVFLFPLLQPYFFLLLLPSSFSFLASESVCAPWTAVDLTM